MQWEFPLKPYKFFHPEELKRVLLPFVQDYTSYQNHILLCKRSPKEKICTVVVSNNNSMAMSKGCCGIFMPCIKL